MRNVKVFAKFSQQSQITFLSIEKGFRLMNMKLAALLASVAMVTGTGIAQADNATQNGAQSVNGAQSLEIVPLTDVQMDELTAGHYTGKWHKGWYRDKHHKWVYGNHYWDYGPKWYDGKKMEVDRRAP